MIKKLRLGRFSLFVAVLLSGTTSAQDPAPGKRVELDGFSLHYLAAGQGDLPVVLFHGEGDVALIWSLVLPKVGTFTKAIAIDEHGMGWSDYGHLANTLRQKAFDFRRLLKKEKIPGPYILVGHSKGGLIAQEFARRYLEDVAGMVLVDSSHVDFMLRFRQKDGSFKWQKVRSRAKGKPIPPIQDQPIPAYEFKHYPMKIDVSETVKDFGESEKKLFHALYNREASFPVGLKSYFSDELQWMASHPLDLGERPLVVISAGIRQYQGDDTYSEAQLIAVTEGLQKDLLNLSKQSQHMMAEKSGHRIQLDQPDLLVKAIRDLHSRLASK